MALRASGADAAPQSTAPIDYSAGPYRRLEPPGGPPPLMSSTRQSLIGRQLLLKKSEPPIQYGYPLEYQQPAPMGPCWNISDGCAPLMPYGPVTVLHHPEASEQSKGHNVWSDNELYMAGPIKSGRPSSINSFDTQAPSSAGSTFSPVQTAQCGSWTTNNSTSRSTTPLQKHYTMMSSKTADSRAEVITTGGQPMGFGQIAGDAGGAGNGNGNDDVRPFVCLSAMCGETFPSAEELDAHTRLAHAHKCHWNSCDNNPAFPTRSDLVWHVNVEHLLVCPVAGCTERDFDSTRHLQAHMRLAHPQTVDDLKSARWKLLGAGASVMVEEELSLLPPPKLTISEAEGSVSSVSQTDETKRQEIVSKVAETFVATLKTDREDKALQFVARFKRKCNDKLRNVADKKARKTAATPRAADIPTFPMVFEHAVLPFLAEFLPKWCDTRHVISVSKGRTPQSRRICVMTRNNISLTRKMIIARHVLDLLPEKFQPSVSFTFSIGEVDRLASVWARGLGRELKDDVCSARNPFRFRNPCMGDSVGPSEAGGFGDSTSTLGPCLIVGGGSFWLANFHPFMEAYRSLRNVDVEHPSPQDREECLGELHDAMSQVDDFRVGGLSATSGLDLKTTRVSHDAYWEDVEQDPPLTCTDWALITAGGAVRPNMLRRFPSETQPPVKEPLVTLTSSVVPGASVVSSGRTSGYQRGQICEIPAYVSGNENGTRKATREWFVEEPDGSDDEDSWIRGGIGVEGDSGAAIVDAETGCLVGQLWGRNKYWGPGPRHTYFTLIADIFDDIQEKCSQTTRPQLPQQCGDSADRYPVMPSCQKCYDLRVYLDSRRSSRTSIQSMCMMVRDGDQDVNSISELETPHGPPEATRSQEVEVIDQTSYQNIHSPVPMASLFPGTPPGSYPTMLSLDGLVSPIAESQTARFSLAPMKRRKSSNASPLPLFTAAMAAAVPAKRSKTLG